MVQPSTLTTAFATWQFLRHFGERPEGVGGNLLSSNSIWFASPVMHVNLPFVKYALRCNDEKCSRYGFRLVTSACCVLTFMSVLQ